MCTHRTGIVDKFKPMKRIPLLLLRVSDTVVATETAISRHYAMFQRNLDARFFLPRIVHSVIAFDISCDVNVELAILKFQALQ